VSESTQNRLEVGSWAQTEMDAHAVIDMGLQPAEVRAITLGWRRMMLAAQQKMLAMKAYTWQLLNCPFAPNLTHTCQQAPETAPGCDRCNPATGSTQHVFLRRHSLQSCNHYVGGQLVGVNKEDSHFIFTIIRTHDHRPSLSLACPAHTESRHGQRGRRAAAAALDMS
jgi:hypothetical protein